jgi:predicted DNA binding CopG/RHH family protein
MSASETNTDAAKPWEAFDQDLDESNVCAVTEELEKQIDESLGLQMISIRLQRDLLVKLKTIAKHHGVGYQPLIRDLLNRFARSEMRLILSSMLEQKRKELEKIESEEASEAPLAPVDDFFNRERKQA